MRKLIPYACLFTATALAVFSCSKDKTVIPSVTTTILDPVDMQQVRQDIQKSLLEIQKVQDIDLKLETRMAGQFIVVPPGSNNALAQAIQDAGEGGIVYLRTGLHTETVGIVITKRVILIGENGAILKIKSTVGLPDANGEDYTNGSPITFAKNLKGDLLIVHGTGDDNVHYQGTETLINELIKHNKQFTMMAYPNRTHGIFEGENTTRHLFTMLTKYLNEHLPVK